MYNVRYFKPDNSVSWLVKQFLVIEMSGQMQIEDKFVPRQDASLVFHFNTLPYIIEPIETELKPFFVAPLLRKAIKMKISGKLDTFIISCHPSVMSRVFKIDMTSSRELSINLPENTFLPLWKVFNTCNTTEQRIDCFTSFLNKIQSRSYQNDLIDNTYNNIINNCITKPLYEILKSTPKSFSAIRRNFIKRIGISPKTLSRIVRVNYLWEKIKNQKDVDFHELVFDGNYFDQAHFIKDFKAITGETPCHIFKRNTEFTNILSGRRN